MPIKVRFLAKLREQQQPNGPNQAEANGMQSAAQAWDRATSEPARRLVEFKAYLPLGSLGAMAGFVGIIDSLAKGESRWVGKNTLG